MRNFTFIERKASLNKAGYYINNHFLLFQVSNKLAMTKVLKFEDPNSLFGASLLNAGDLNSDGYHG